MTSVSYDVLNKLPQTALCNWHIFFPPMPSNIHMDHVSHPEAGVGTFLWNSGTNNTHYAMQTKNYKFNLILIFVLFNKYFKWYFYFLTSINFSICVTNASTTLICPYILKVQDFRKYGKLNVLNSVQPPTPFKYTNGKLKPTLN